MDARNESQSEVTDDLPQSPCCHLELSQVFQLCPDLSMLQSGTRIMDMSKGCDQLVYMVETIAYGRVVVKIPKEEKDKVDKQRIMSQLANRHGISCSEIVDVSVHSPDFLVETYVPGETLSLEQHGPCASVWYTLGQQMKALHSIPGASGYSNRVVGETCDKFPIFETYHEKVMASGGGLTWTDTSHSIPNVDEYLELMLSRSHLRCAHIQPVFLHYDITFDNVIVSFPSTTTIPTAISSATTAKVTLIDFADAGMGDPLEDFAFLYCSLYDEPLLLEYLFSGYGGITETERTWIEFYCVVWLTWALSSGSKQPARRAHQLHVVERIVQKAVAAL